MDKTKMLKKLFIILILDIARCFSQDAYQRPSFPDVFQAEIEGTFKEENGVVEIDASMYYDRLKNRAALFILKENELTRQAYDFDNDESITIDGNDCDVQEIPDQQGFFPFTIDNGKKKMSPAEEAFFFTKSKLDMQSLTEVGIPTLVYRANVDIPQYGQKNCDVTHVFSKPDIELAICKEGLYCKSTLISLSVQCKNEQGETIVDHVYRFSRFRYNIEDESVFLPPPGIHCEMKNTQPMSPFPSYFSFTYDIIENPKDDEKGSSTFKMHKEIWYDADYKIVRLDEFENDGLHFSSRLFDLNAEVAFTIVGSNPTCDIGLAPSDFKLDETTRLPKLFFAQNDTTAAVFVGKRKVHGLDYQVWSLMWTDSQSAARVVEEAYFLQIDPNEDIVKASKQSYSQISHIDMHTYEMNEDSQQFKLTLLEHFSVYNYRTKPKEWSAFDVSSCFKKNQKKKFSIKIEKFPLVKGSQSYREVLEHFYDKIIAATKVSVIRISELRGIFDGVLLLEIRGSILDNSKSSGWPTNSKEPGMEKTFEAIKRAASEGKLSITLKGEDKKAKKIKVISVEALDDSPPEAKSSCYSGASMAAASLVLLLIGVSFGIAGYYVFLKKRKLSNTPVRMKELDS